MIEATGLRLSLSGRVVLKDISISLQHGEVTTVIGPSGSGKTSLLRVLGLLQAPDAGLLKIDDWEYNFPGPIPRQGPWPTVTCVFQDLYLWPHLTLRENILLPVRLRARLAEGQLQEELASLVSQLDLSDCIDRRPHEVSGGQKQRAAVARAILLQPKYLLLDEITSALDIEQVAAILMILSGLRKKDLGLFIVSHHIEFAKRASDHVIFLEDGEIIEQGPPSILDVPATDRLGRFLDFVRIAR